jgi:ribosomal protein S12 methylthiotransferase accessory factor
VDIQGVREDLAPAHAALTELNLHTRRASSVNRRHWFLGESKARRRLCDMNSHSFDDLQLDIDYIVSCLASRGIHQVVVVDFPSICPFVSVVRVVVPGLESWAMNHGTVGTRALEHWRRHV